MAGKLKGAAPKVPARWLLFVHQLPAKPAYLRVKVWRRLQSIGAVALKNSIYALPGNEQTIEGFRRLLREIERSGGEGIVCEAEIVAGLRDDQIQRMFNAARDADYQTVATALRAITQVKKRSKDREAELRLKLAKIRQQLDDIIKIDFFGASGRAVVDGLLSRLEHSFIAKPDGAAGAARTFEISALVGKIWVTRQDIHVDRIACSWLIRRFIDAKARFKFVTDKKYPGAPGELRFDMADAEFTHEGEKCSFEVFVERLGSSDPALIAIAQIIHDLDLKDDKFARPEAPGIGHVIEGICMAQDNDLERLARGSALFDDTYERFRRSSRK